MPKLSAHQVSLRTRGALRAVIEKYGLEEEPLRKFGLIDRIVRGYLHALDGNARIAWSCEPPLFGVREYHVVADVVSSRDIVEKGALTYKEKMKWRRPYKIGARFVLDDGTNLKEDDGYEVYSLEEIGREYEFSLRGRPEKIVGHACEDSLFQSGLKGIPTACYHACAVRFVVPPELNKNVENIGRNIKFTGEYGPIEDILVDLYKEMERHRLRSAQRLNLLYKCSRGELGAFRFGKEFLKSVEQY